MTKRIALLRAVNVGGTGVLPMARLRAVAAGIGLGAPQTVLQSGNLVFEVGAAGDGALEVGLEQALAADAGLVTDVVVRDGPAWRGLIADNPMIDAAEAAPAAFVVVALKAEPSAAALEALGALAAGGERIAARGRAIYAAFPQGLGRSRLAAALSAKGGKLTGTARNWNTVRRIAASLDA